MSDLTENAKSKERSKSALIITLVSLFTVFIIPIIFILSVTFLLPSVYEDTFVGELSEKYELLNSTDEPKIVVVGGSSVAFGLDSAKVTEEFGMPVVNFGLYANLGTKLMMDLSKSNINEGDVIVLAPEMNSQTLSLYFNADTAMQALDGNFSMLKDIDRDNYSDLAGALWNFASDKLSYTVSDSTPKNTGAYSKEWFNEYGDSTFDRPYNVMTLATKNIAFDMRYDDSDGINTEYEEFIEYLNEYVDFCRECGATVYFSFPPMSQTALTDYNTRENVMDFYENLSHSVNAKVISNIYDYILDEGYFFDSEFHLNNNGVVIRTVRLIDDLKREMGKTDITMSESDLPPPSGFAPVDFTDGEEENLYFELELTKNGAGQSVWMITGLNEEGKKQLRLSIPNNTNGHPVAIISEGAFADSELRVLTVGKNVSAITSGAFSGAKHLESVYINAKIPDEISVPNNADPNGLMTKDAPGSLKFYVPSESLGDFKTDYFWGDYAAQLIGYQ